MREGVYLSVTEIIGEVVLTYLQGEGQFETIEDIIGVVQWDLGQALDNAQEIVYDKLIGFLESE